MTLEKESKQQFSAHLPSVTNESSLTGTADPGENHKLQQELSVLKSNPVYLLNVYTLKCTFRTETFHLHTT